MNQHGDERNGRVHRSSLFSRRGVRHREDDEPDAETLAEEDPYGIRVADLVRSMDSNTADRRADENVQQADAEQTDAEAADIEPAVEPAEVAADAAVADAADEGGDSAQTVADPAATKDDRQSAAQVAGDADGAGVDSAARVLGLAQKLHDEYVAEGQNTRDTLISEGQARYDELVSAGEVKRVALIAEADALVVEAQQRKAVVLQGLGNERRTLEAEIEGLRSFEREYRAQLKSYLEGQLTELEQTAADEPGSQSSPEATPAEATQAHL